MKHRLSFSIILALTCGGPLGAETISAARLRSFRQILKPVKVTVGPDDQFQSATDPSGKFIVFTHRADLVAHLRAQDLATGLVSELTPLDADAQDPSFAEDGRLAFTYYRANARGDVCYVPKRRAQGGRFRKVVESEVRCLKRAENDRGSERSSPFWVSDDTLGFVVREIDTQTTRIVAENLKTHAQQTLARGKVWAPTMKSGGRYLVFSTVNPSQARRQLAIKDLRSGRVTALALAVPGASGFAAVSADERWVYFSHFLNDTNQDQAIDGGDHAVVFRVSVARVLSGTAAVLPEQLTSVENSCSFPRPFGADLYVTCAFEGALDIYRLPVTGMVPSDWDKNILDQAYRSSRSYGERVLLLNTMGSRGIIAEGELHERLLSNYLLDDDNAAARFYLARLAESPGGDQAILAPLKIYLEGRERQQAEPPGERSRAYLAELAQLKKRLAELGTGARGDAGRFRELVLAHLRVSEGSTDVTALKRLKPPPAAPRLEHFLYFELADRLLIRPDQQPQMLPIYRDLITAEKQTPEARIYYTYQAIRAISDLEKTFPGRRQGLEKFSVGLPPVALALVNAELKVIELESSTDPKKKQKKFNELDQMLRAASADYFLRKAMNVRAVLELTKAGDNQYLEAVAANWIRDTNQGDPEFIYAREVVSSSALDEAYGFKTKGNYAFAASFFYSALGLTDDLEAHAGYVETEFQKNERGILTARYKFLKSHGFVAENMKYVEALTEILDARALDSKAYLRALDHAITKLLAMGESTETPVRQLLLGFAYSEKLRRTANGLEFEGALFEKAHRALMLAYDQGRDSERVRASALFNLGLLHQRAANFGLSARFFALRKLIGFETAAERANFAWFYSRSLFHIYQFELAARELGEVPKEMRAAPLIERQAFYTALGGDAARAVDLYAEFLNLGGALGNTNAAKIGLGRGYALLKAKREDEARLVLEAARAAAASLAKIPRGGERVLDFEPRRVELIATGLLARLGSPAERVIALKKRAALLEGAEKIVDGWAPAVIENEQQIAALSKPAEAASHMRRALKAVAKFADQNGYLGNAVYRTLINYLVLARLDPDLYRGDAQLVRALTKKALGALEKNQPFSSVEAADGLKLRLLSADFAARAGGEKAESAADVLSGEAAKLVKAELPPRFAELERLRRALERKAKPGS